MPTKSKPLTSASLFKRVKIPFRTKNSSIDVFLVQSQVDVDDHGRCVNQDAQLLRIRTAIKRIFDEDGTSRPGIQFLIFPELSFPRTFPDLLDEVAPSAGSSPTVLVFGVELLVKKELQSLRTSLEVRGAIKHWPSVDRAKSTQPMNLAIVALFSHQKWQFLGQLKFAPSKYEVAPNLKHNEFVGDHILHVSLGDHVAFMVLVCSDFAIARNDATPTIAERLVLDYRTSAGAGGQREILDFIFNIQFNPSPNDKRFSSSIRRLFELPRDKHSPLCLVMCNALSSAASGQSRMLVSNIHKVHASGSLARTIPAPVSGLSLGKLPGVLRLHLESPLRLWDGDGSPNQYHYSYLPATEETSSEANSDGQVWSVLPEPTGVFSDVSTLPDLAKRLSSLGRHEDSFGVYELAAEWMKTSGRPDQHVDMLRLAGTELRHLGLLGRALKYYSDSSEALRRLPKNPDSKRLGAKLHASRTLTESFLLRGDLAASHREYLELLKRLGFTETIGAPRTDDPDKLNLLRQVAEMERLLGDLERALERFRQLAAAYGYSQHEEMAHARLGEANCLRMMGKINESEEILCELLHYSGMQRAVRFKPRILMAQIEVNHELKKPFVKELHDLREIATGYGLLFASLYAEILSGVGILRSSRNKNGATKAKAHFIVALDIAANSKHVAEWGPIRMESALARIGFAVCDHVLKGLPVTEVPEFFEVEKEFASIGLAWGNQVVANMRQVSRSTDAIVATLSNIP